MHLPNLRPNVPNIPNIRLAPPPPNIRLAPALLLAALSGAAWGASHAAEPRPLLAAVALAPLLVALGCDRPLLVGWLSGAVGWICAIPWIVPTITIYGQLDGWLAGLALLLLGLYLGLSTALFSLFAWRLWRRGDPLSLAALPALWVVSEALRATGLDGFPWNLAAYAWIDLPGALPLASWIGAWGVSALVALVGVGLARAVTARRWEPLAVGLLLPALALALGERFARPGPEPPAAAMTDVRVLQPNIPNRPFFDRAKNEDDYRRLVGMTEALCEPGRLLVWPESAAWPRAYQDDATLRWDLERFARAGCSVVLNSAWDEGEKTYNSVLLVERDTSSGDGIRVERTDKRHLVPFGEFVPFRRALPFLGTIARTVGDFSPSDRLTLLERRGTKLGVAVCYEVIFPYETSALVRAGANILITVTNDAWYGDTAAPRQHLRAARFRAAENRRWLLRAAVTGISAIVRPDGAFEGELQVGEQGALAALIPRRADLSPFSRAPWLVPALCWAVAAIAIVRARRAPDSSLAPSTTSAASN